MPEHYDDVERGRPVAPEGWWTRLLDWLRWYWGEVRNPTPPGDDWDRNSRGPW
jgi:hypothetical protein